MKYCLSFLLLAAPLGAAETGTWLDGYFRPYAGRGAMAVAVVRNGEGTTRSYGTSPDSVFRMASLSKVVTAYAVIRSGLDPNARYDGTPVTLGHLLTHTSGIDDAFFGNTARLADSITLEEHFRRRPPRFGRPPGREIVYSNEGFALAGHLLERASGKPFESVIEEQVFRPLGMSCSTFAQPPPFRVVVSGAEGERLVQAPAGAMVSDAAGMARLMIALLSDEPAARVLRATQFPGVAYGLFENEIGGYRGLFHTGRSGHESVLYLIPDERIGVFLVSTGGIDRELRRRFVRDFIAAFLPPRPQPQPGSPRISAGTYRPFLLPRHRVEHAGNLATDTSVTVDGDVIAVRLPPFARGQALQFTNGITADGFVIRGAADRFTITGPLFEPMTFEWIRWWQTGRVHIAAAIAGLLILLSAAIRRRGAALAVVLLLLAAPIAFAAAYLTRSAAERPFAVDIALRAALTPLLLASIAGLWLGYAAWRSKSVHDCVAAAVAIAIPFVLNYWNLLGWRF